MTSNSTKADVNALETMLEKESALYKEALRKDIPFKFIKAIHLRVKNLSRQLQRLGPIQPGAKTISLKP